MAELGETLDLVCSALGCHYQITTEVDGTHVLMLMKNGEIIIGRSASNLGRALTRVARRARRIYAPGVDLPPLPDPTVEED